MYWSGEYSHWDIFVNVWASKASEAILGILRSFIKLNKMLVLKITILKFLVFSDEDSLFQRTTVYPRK
jgi:hypothetical protein